jgi:hypothetical protein
VSKLKKMTDDSWNYKGWTIMVKWEENKNHDPYASFADYHSPRGFYYLVAYPPSAKSYTNPRFKVSYYSKNIALKEIRAMIDKNS